jgi:hypothetical protein
MTPPEVQVDHPECKPVDLRTKDLRLMPRFTHAHDPLLGPPQHVLAEVDAAWERAQDLFADELELHFALEPLTQRVTAQLLVPGGEAWERLSATEALALACGDAEVVADEHSHVLVA